MEALRQEVAEEAADELIGCEGHDLVARTAVGAMVLVPEGDAVPIARNQPAVGDGRLAPGSDPRRLRAGFPDDL
jgi:hypothetical protein